MATPLTLQIFKGDAWVATQTFERDVIKIGRLASAHLRLDDERVSRIHSVLEVSPDGVIHVVDMGSLEGTLLNGRRVSKARLEIGDSLRVGATTLKLDAASPAPIAEAALTTPAPATALATALLTPVVLEPGPLASPPVPTTIAPNVSATSSPRASAPPPVPVTRGDAARGPRGPMGASVRFLWGRYRVGEFFLGPDRQKRFTVGTAPDVDFVLDDPALHASSFPLVAVSDRRFHVRFTAQMEGALHRSGTDTTLTELAETGAVIAEDGFFELTLGTQDVVTLRLGGVTVEIGLARAPASVWVPWQESVNFAALNIFLVVFFLATLFVVAATNHIAEGTPWEEDRAAMETLDKRVPVPRRPIKPIFETTAAQNRIKPGAASPGAGSVIGRPDARPPHTAPRPAQAAGGPEKDPRLAALALARRILPVGGVGGLLDQHGVAEVAQAMGDVRGNVVADKNGLGGMKLFGDKSPGGNHGTVGIDGVGTKFGNRPGASERAVAGILGRHHPNELPPIESEVKITGIDPELVRRVIHSHRDQVRACYELELMRKPNLGGKVKVRFIITEAGSVATTGVTENSSESTELGDCISRKVKTWIFPIPKSSGGAVVSYPFMFKRSGN